MMTPSSLLKKNNNLNLDHEKLQICWLKNKKLELKFAQLLNGVARGEQQRLSAVPPIRSMWLPTQLVGFFL